VVWVWRGHRRSSDEPRRHRTLQMSARASISSGRVDSSKYSRSSEMTIIACTTRKEAQHERHGDSHPTLTLLSKPMWNSLAARSSSPSSLSPACLPGPSAENDREAKNSS